METRFEFESTTNEWLKQTNGQKKKRKEHELSKKNKNVCFQNIEHVRRRGSFTLLLAQVLLNQEWKMENVNFWGKIPLFTA
jgi:hypothetical protein